MTAARFVTSTGATRTSAPARRHSVGERFEQVAAPGADRHACAPAGEHGHQAAPMPELAPVTHTRACFNFIATPVGNTTPAGRPGFRRAPERSRGRIPVPSSDEDRRADWRIRKEGSDPHSPCASAAYLQLRDQRQMVRRHQRLPRAGELHAGDLDVALVVDVIEVQDREEARDRCAAAAGACCRSIACSRSDRSVVASPRIHSLKSPSTTFAPGTRRSLDDRREALRLEAALEVRGAEVHVVEVQQRAVEIQVDALAAARLARLPRQVVLRVVPDGKPAEHDVAEERAAQLPRPAPSPSPCRAPRRAARRGRRRSGPAPITSCSARMSASSDASTAAVRSGRVRPSMPRQRWML